MHKKYGIVGSNLGVETFLKKMEHQKRMRYNRGLRHLCILCIEVSRKSCLPFNCFLVIKGIPKALFSFISWLLNFSDLPMAQIWGKDLHYGYGAPSSLFGVKSPQPFDTPFDSLRWAPLSLVYTYVLAKLLRNGAKFIQKLIPDFKNHSNLATSDMTSSEKTKKLKFNELHFSKNYTPLAKTYTEDLSNFTLTYLCENSPNSLCHFWSTEEYISWLLRQDWKNGILPTEIYCWTITNRYNKITG